MRQFFESLTTIDHVRSLIDNSERESDNLDYKKATQPFGNSEKDDIAKDVSSFANSGGGIIIYGVTTDPSDKTRPVAIEAIHPANIESFDRVVNSKIQPPVAGWQKRLIPNDQPQVMVIFVPQSDDPPHQSLADKKYYRRAGIESIPMTHDLIALHFGRRLGPILSLRLSVKESSIKFSEDGYSDPKPLKVFIENTGKRVAKYVKVVICYPRSNVRVTLHPGRFPSDKVQVVDSNPEQIWVQFTENIGVFHPGKSEEIFSFGLRVSKDFVEAHSKDPLFEWIIYSDEMIPKKGGVSLRDLDLKPHP